MYDSKLSFFQVSKNHNSVNICRRKKSYLKKIIQNYLIYRRKIFKGIFFCGNLGVGVPEPTVGEQVY